MSDATVSKRSYVADIIIFMAMFSVACAAAVALVLEMNIEPTVAASFAAMGCLAAAVGHVLLRKIYRVAQLQAELASIRTIEQPLDQEAAPVFQNEKNISAFETKVTPHSQGEVKKQGLARLHIKNPVPQSSASKPVMAGQTTDIDGIIRRLADDIANGRRAQHGVSFAQAKPETPTLQAAALQSRKSNVVSESPELLMSRKVVEQLPDQAPANAADKLAAVAEALAREELDVFLEPIHGLDDGSARHFEVSIRLKLADEDVMGMNDYSEAAQGTAWLPLIDVVKVSQAKRVALYLLRRGESGAFMSQIHGESVSVGKSFSDDLASVMGHDQLMSGRLVLSLTQDDVRDFSPVQWATIARLKQLGFRFAIAEVNSLDMDFEMLAQQGFAFAKLDASVFLEGLPAAQALIPPTDVCRYLAGNGLTLVVNGLADEEQKAKVLGFGAVYGQGVLFGAPRPVKTEALKNTGQLPVTSVAADFAR